MLRKMNIIKSVCKSGVVAVLRGNEEEVVKTAEASIEGGINSIEITMTVPNAMNVLIRLKDKYVSKDVYFGMGTVLDDATANHAIQSGADFIVSPHLDTEIILACNRYQVPVIPGAFTMTEIVTAMKAGCEVIKLFPANTAGVGHISNVKGPLPQANIMPTGGVNENNIKEWIKAGAVAVGIGSNLQKAGGANLDKEKIIEYVRHLVLKVQEARNEL